MKKLLVACSLFFPLLAFGFTVKGTVSNAGKSRYRVSLFHLRNGAEFFLLADYNLVQYTFTDTSGNFTLQADLTPEEETLYRLHIKKITYPQDTLGDLITSASKSGKLSASNYFFLPLTSSSLVEVTIKNTENMIYDHKTSPPTPAFTELYALFMNYNARIQAVDDRKAASYHNLPNGKAEIDNLVKERRSKLKDTLVAQLVAFVSRTANINAAVVAYRYIELCGPPSLHQKVSLWEQMKQKGRANKYLPSISQELEEEKGRAKLSFLQGYAVAVSILCVLLLVLFGWLGYYYQRVKAELRDLKNNKVDAYAILSRKEIEIFEMLGRGLSNKEIAAAQFLEQSTVKKHITNIYSKTGIKNRQEAMALFKKANPTG